MDATALRRRPIRLSVLDLQPAFPPTVHLFRDPIAGDPDATGIATQCARCWGWRDDPRHLTPPSYLERTEAW